MNNNEFTTQELTDLFILKINELKNLNEPQTQTIIKDLTFVLDSFKYKYIEVLEENIELIKENRKLCNYINNLDNL